MGRGYLRYAAPATCDSHVAARLVATSLVATTSRLAVYTGDELLLISVIL